tara:strand:+ start:176 stop:577 length:402 start_codon:yes stop_codon:yes gene_type:complete
MLPLNVWVSDDVSPNILDPSVSKIDEVTIEDVKAVTVRLDTVISVAAKEVTEILAASASESTPPSFIEIVLPAVPSKVVPVFNCRVALSTVKSEIVADIPVNPDPSPTNAFAVIVALELILPEAVTGPTRLTP